MAVCPLASVLNSPENTGDLENLSAGREDVSGLPPRRIRFRNTSVFGCLIIEVSAPNSH